VNIAWQDVDNTPSDWNAVEATHAPWWEGITDSWSRLWYEFSKWRWGDGEWKRYLLWLVAPLILLLAGRLFFQKQWTRTKARLLKRSHATSWPGMDSEFYRLERVLAERGIERRAGETLTDWLNRAARDARIAVETLRPLLKLHYKLRFDPDGLNAQDRAALRSGAELWNDAPAA
jgi:hypothetical protein